MPRLFIPRSAIDGTTAVLEGDAARHLAGSLRLRAGDTITVADDATTEHLLRIVSATTSRIEASVVTSRPATGDPRLHVEVIQALPKDSMDDAIDAMVQCGVAVIRPVITENTVARPAEERAQRRLERWRSIAREAAQLSFRASIPRVEPLTTLAAALASVPAGSRLLACVIDATSEPLSSLQDADTPAVICIGPEGGFGPADLAALDAAGAGHVHLGSRVIRSRLAGAIATAVLLAAAGDLRDAGPPAIPES